GATLVLIALYIFYEAYKRFLEPPQVASVGMLTIGIIGLFVNIFVAWVLMRGDTDNNLNLRAAFLHVLGDLLGSVGAIVAALLIMFFNWSWADPLASVIVAVLVLISGGRVVNDSIHVLMEGTPKNVDFEEIIETIKSSGEIENIHDLHIWSITSNQNALSCHAVASKNLTLQECQSLLKRLERQLLEKGVGHITIQLETSEHSHEDSILCIDHKDSHPNPSH
ncbi:cation diffusion facilitator family transporter, partial [Pseudoalteromonas sp. BZP1]|uniref:cation diffusion facilitator family transporter n=1 Tax=Pseudoalteromonas sp. BZP1 TaxID=3136671 RepID=UPI0032C4993A